MTPNPCFRPLPSSFFRRSAELVAPDLLGRYLIRQLAGERLVLRLVETEAYLGSSDPASHAWNGRRTSRNESLYLPGGFAYVYFVYGMHYCLNVVTGEAGEGAAVLLRAGEAVEGADRMTTHRNLRRMPRSGDLAGGPGKLCQALAVDRRHDGISLRHGELRLAAGEPVLQGEILIGARVGISYSGEAANWPLRFAVGGNPHVSRPRPG